MSSYERAFARARECIDDVRLFAYDDDHVALLAIRQALERYDAWWDAETGGPSPFHGTAPDA